MGGLWKTRAADFSVPSANADGAGLPERLGDHLRRVENCAGWSPGFSRHPPGKHRRPWVHRAPGETPTAAFLARQTISPPPGRHGRKLEPAPPLPAASDGNSSNGPFGRFRIRACFQVQGDCFADILSCLVQGIAFGDTARAMAGT